MSGPQESIPARSLNWRVYFVLGKDKDETTEQIIKVARAKKPERG
jgi:hypothetical protein